MSSISVVVACSDPEIESFIIEYLTTFDYKILQSTSYGFDCVSAVEKYSPDIVFCGMYLYDMSACQLIQTVKNAGNTKTAFILAGNMNGVSVADKLILKGAEFYTLVPFDYLYIEQRIQEIVLQKSHNPGFVKYIFGNDNDKQDEKLKPVVYVNRYLHELGLPSSMRGYKYICDAVTQALKDQDILKSLTKQLYPYIAKLNNTSEASVERAIRGAVKRLWDRGNCGAINTVFGYTIDGENPTNGEFISVLTEHIKQDLGIF